MVGVGADGFPSHQVRQYRKLLLEKCLCSLRGPVSPSVTSEGMEALAKVLAELREGDVGSAFDAISERCRTFFDNVSPRGSLAPPRPGPGGGPTNGCWGEEWALLVPREEMCCEAGRAQVQLGTDVLVD